MFPYILPLCVITSDPLQTLRGITRTFKNDR